MRAISPDRQTGVATHLFNPFEQLGETATPLNSTWESASPLKFGQDLVKVSAELKRTEESRSRVRLTPSTRGWNL